MYTKEESLASCLEYFKGDMLAAKVTVEKYLLKDKDGVYLEKDPDQMYRRLSAEFARVEGTYPNPLSEPQIYADISEKIIIAQGSPSYGVGNNHSITSVSNCFVLDPPMDSYSGILKTDEELVSILKRRGGAGFSMSSLRPKGSIVSNSAGTSDGITSFMERYSNTTKEVATNGRRGALMLSLHCHHPDLISFINAKKDKSKINGANISVMWTDDFLNCVRDNKEFTLRWPVECTPETAKIKVNVNAREVWNQFVQSNWDSAEPGCLFWDTVINNSLSDCYDFPTVGVNPCAELSLSARGSCILILLNLSKFVIDPFKASPKFNYTMFKEKLLRVSHMADDLVDLELEKIQTILTKIKSDPEPEDLKQREIKLWEGVADTCAKGRRVGIGITGLADCLAMLGLKYDSDKSLVKADNIFKSFHTGLMEAQHILSQERGSFKDWDWEKEKNCCYITCLDKGLQEKIKASGRRNISFSTISPAGTISLVAQSSSGVEPVFQLEYNRKRKLSSEELAQGAKADSTDADGIKWANYTVHHHGLEQWKKENPDKDLRNSPYSGATAHDIDWKYKVRLQSTIQKYITHSISNTCNLPKDVTPEEVSKLYLQGWEAGLKGMTIYRDGSRDGVLTTKKEETRRFPKRPEWLSCDIHYATIEGNQWAFFIGRNPDAPYEIFGGRKTQIEIPRKYKTGWIRKAGKIDKKQTYDLYLGTQEESPDRIIVRDIASSFSSTAASYTRMLSTMLREGVPVKIICEQLLKDTEASIFCFEKGACKVLKTYIKDGDKASGMCGSCGAEALQYRDGCVYCAACGYSKCG